MAGTNGNGVAQVRNYLEVCLPDRAAELVADNAMLAGKVEAAPAADEWTSAMRAEGLAERDRRSPDVT